MAQGGTVFPTSELFCKPASTAYTELCLSPLITTEALFAASCNDLDDKCAYRIVTLGSEWPNICCTSYKVRPPFTKKEAY